MASASLSLPSSPYGRITERVADAMLEAYSSGDCRQATALADQILDANFTHIDSHVVTRLCHRKAGDLVRSEQSRAVVNGLIGSILGSGDGKTPETAVVVIATEEEYKTLDALGLRVIQRSLVRQGTSAFDRFEVKSPGAIESITLYFNVDRPMATLLKATRQPK